MGYCTNTQQILLVFVVAFALALSALTNASRSEMFGASAGYGRLQLEGCIVRADLFPRYTAVLIVFLTFTGS